MESIYINDYIEFNTDDGWFEATNKTQNILYREKEVICSYSGCVEWSHQFFCQLLDLYCGGSKYNYSLGTVVHEKVIEQLYKEGRSGNVINWINKHKDDDWFVKAAAMFANIVEDVPANSGE